MPAPTSVSVDFPTLTEANRRVLWATYQDANAFFGAFTITLSGENLPEATATTLGGVKALEIVDFDSPDVDDTTYYNHSVDGVLVAQLPLKASYDQLKSRVDYINAQLEALWVQLAAKGYTAEA